MNKKVFNAHPITAVFLLRSWWFVFTAPLVRITLQYFISKQAQKILLSEAVLLVLALIVSLIGWLSAKIVTHGNTLTIKKGVFVKTSVTINRSKLFGVSAKANLLFCAIGAVKCSFKTNAESNKNCKIILKGKDFRKIGKSLNLMSDFPFVKRQKNAKRYFATPISLFFATIVGFCIGSILKEQIIVFNFSVMVFLWLFILFYGVLYYYDYKKGKLCIGKTIYAKTRSFFGIKTFCCNKGKVGIIKITQNPFDCRWHSCKIKITLLGEGGDAVGIKYIDYKSATEQIKTVFNNKNE